MALALLALGLLTMCGVALGASVYLASKCALAALALRREWAKEDRIAREERLAVLEAKVERMANQLSGLSMSRRA